MSDSGPLSEENVIWKKGDGPMPEKVQHVVDAARGELLLETLHLPEAVENTLRRPSE